MLTGYKFRLITGLLLLMIGAALTGCNRNQADQANSLLNIKLPDHLTAETADLEIKGKLRTDGPVYLDLETIQAFPAVSFSSEDPWDKKKHHYTGVLLNELIRFLGIGDSATYIEVIAANKYKIPIRLSDLEKYEYLLAYKIDGELLIHSKKLTRKGAMVIAINFDKHTELDVEIYKNQLVWQVKSIIVF